MTPIEALEWAADYVDRIKLFTAPLNDRGYPVDGYKRPTPEERTNAIVLFASQVQDQVKPDNPNRTYLQSLHDNLHGAYVDRDWNNVATCIANIESRLG